MHPKIFDIIREIKDMGISIGLVSNGLMLKDVTIDVFSRITWIRISSMDHRGFPKRYQEKLEEAIEKGPNIDWSFSHVVTRRPNYKTIKGIIKFANSHAFTHVRLVSDLLDLEATRNMGAVKEKITEAGINDDIVIYQGRKKFTKGRRNCYISLLKPVVGADGYIYPCCGTQYALENPSRDYEKTMRMGKAKDIDKLYEQQNWFDGCVCSRCYYDNYNQAIETLLSDIHHKEFI